MLGGVGAILELLQDDTARDAVAQGFCGLDGTRHTVLATGQTNLCTIGFHQVTALDAHRLGHRQDQLITLDGTHEGQTYTRITARRLDNGGTWLQKALLLCILNHRQSDTVLHTTARIEKFHLGDHWGLQTLCF